MAQRVGERVEVPVLGVRALGERAGVLERTVQDPDRARPRGCRRCFTASAAICPAPTTTTSRPASPPSASSARSAPSATNASGAAPSEVSWRTRRPARDAAWNRPVSAGPGGVLGLGAPQRLADLGVDLRLAEHHRVEPGGDGEQVVGGVVLPVRVQGLGQLLGAHAAGLGEQALQGQEPGVIARHARRDLDAVAGRQDHGLVDPVQVEGVAVRLREVVVGEGEPLEQLDRARDGRRSRG